MIPVGSKVIIKHQKMNPDFWDDDGEMMALLGKIAIVERVSTSNTYRLEGYRWYWRERDLLVVGSVDNDPNVAFRIRKES